MTGAIFQLKVKGKQDDFLTGKPEHNFLRQVYKRNVNFATEQIVLSPKEQVDFGKKWSIEIPKLGDYVSKIYFHFKLPALNVNSGEYSGWTNSIGHAILNSVSLEIGGYQVDKRHGLYMEIWNELSKVNSGEDIPIGKYQHINVIKRNALVESEYFVPIDFWFTESVSSALPIFAMNNNDIVINFDLKTFEECIVYDGNIPPDKVNMINPEVLVNYLYIDDAERERLALQEHTYLITQVQTVFGEGLGSGGSSRISLPFNHPCLEMFWVIRETDSELNNDWFNFGKRNSALNSELLPLMLNARLILDGTNRTRTLDGGILNILNNKKYHSGTVDKFIYTMSFCEDPEKWFPTGSLNFSRVSNADLQIEIPNGNPPSSIFVFARNFNIIKFKGGQTYLGFSV